MTIGQEGYLPVQGGQLHYETAGGGPAMVFVHGFSLDMRSWDDQFAEFSKDHFVVRYDLRGFGKSSMPASPYDHCEDLAAVLDHLGVEQAMLVGLSLGANVALRFCLLHPKRVSGCLLASPGLPGHPWPREPRPPDAAKKYAQENGVEAGKQFWLNHPLFASLEDRPKAKAAVADMVKDYTGWHWRENDPQKPAEDIARMLDQMKVQSLILSGELDVEGYREIHAILAQKIAGTQFKVLDQIGHMINLEAPERFNEYVRAVESDASRDRQEKKKMPPAISLNLDQPGTYVYTGAMASEGYRLTKFGLSLRKPANRARFLEDEVAYMREANLSEAEIALVLARDWTALLAAGGHLQAMLKVAATVGQNLWHIGAHNVGLEVEEMMKICPRPVSALPGEQ